MDKEIKPNKKEVTNIELVYEDREELISLASREEFVNFVLEDSLKTITRAIEEDLDKVELFNILNLSLIVELNKPQFKPVLGKITQHYVDVEDYDKCIEIQNLINKL